MPPENATDFDALLAETESLGELAKSLTPTEGAPTGTATPPAGEAAPGDELSPVAAELLAKCLTKVEENGETHDLVDIEPLIKSLVEAHEKTTVQEAQIGTLLKGMSTLAAVNKVLVGAVTKQDALLKAIGDKGRGRNSVLDLHSRPPAGGAPAGKPGLTGEQVLAKSMSAVKGGRMTAVQAALVEVSVAQGATLHPELAALVQAEA